MGAPTISFNNNVSTQRRGGEHECGFFAEGREEPFFSLSEGEAPRWQNKTAIFSVLYGHDDGFERSNQAALAF